MRPQMMPMGMTESQWMMEKSMPPWSRARSAKFFGGGGGSKTIVEAFDPFKGTGTRELFSQLTSAIGPAISALGQGFTPFPGARVAPFGPLQQQALGIAGGLPQLGQQLLGQFGQTIQGGPGFLGGANQLVQDLITRARDPQASRQFQREAFIDPARQFFQEDVLPNVLESFAGGGIAGSPVATREALRQGRLLSTDLSSQLAQAVRGDIGLGITGAQLGQNLAGLPGNLQGQAFGNLGNVLNAIGGFGGQQQAQQQAQIGGQQQLFQEQQPAFDPTLSFLSPALQLGAATPQQGFQFTQQGAPGIGGVLGQGLGTFLGSGGFGDILGGLGGLFGGGGGAAAGAGLGAAALGAAGPAAAAGIAPELALAFASFGI